MPVVPTYPGVYIEEIPSGVRTITGVATSITAFVGYTAEGPLNKAVRIFNFGDYERNFGGLNRDSEIGYAVQQFFLNGGSDAYVVRVAQGAGPAQITLKDASDTDVLQVSAASPGLWGNDVRLDVDYATTNPDSTFNLTVTRYALQNSKLVPVAVEQHRNLSMNSNSSNYAERVVNAASKLIQIARPIGLTSSNHRPAPTGTTSADLADIIGTNITGDFNVVVNDNSTGTPVPIFTGATPTFSLPSTVVGNDLAKKLQELLRALGNPATDGATVKMAGTSLQVVPSADTPNASILLTGAGADAARLTGTGSFVNVQQYSLGLGAAFGAQSGAQGGANGSLPTASDVIGSYNSKTGMYALRDVDLFNLLVIPRTAQMDDTQAKSVMAAAVAFCNEERAFYLVDPEPSKTWDNIGDWVAGLGINERNAAIFFPHVQIADPLDDFRLANVPPSGTVAGVFARIDGARGVWKAPAGIDATLAGVQGLTQILTDQENGVLNPLGINCLRSFPGYGRVIWGARTLRGGDQMADEYKYVPVRRLALFIEESLYRGTQWVVFEPNDEPLWAQIRLNIGAFMHNLFRQGAFQGTTPRDAYFVKCDKETTTQNDINLGIVNIIVGFAPLKPAEFVIIKLQQMAGQIQT